MKKVLSIGLGLFFLASCSTSSDVASNKLFQKRKYKKGWNVNSARTIEEKSKGSEEVAYVEEAVKENDVESSAQNQTTVTESESNSTFSPENSSESFNTSSNEVETKSLFTEKSVDTKSMETINSNESFGSSQEDLFVDEVENNVNNDETEVSTESNDNSSSSDSGVALILLVILAILLPPLAVAIAAGIGTEFLISLLLTLLFWVPGVIYALFVVLRS